MEDWSDFLDPITDWEGNVIGWSDGGIWGCIASIVITAVLILLIIPILALVKGIRALKRGKIGTAVIAFSIPFLYIVVLTGSLANNYLADVANRQVFCFDVEVVINPEQETFRVTRTEKFPDPYTIYVFFHYDNWISGGESMTGRLDTIAKFPISERSGTYPLYYHEYEWEVDNYVFLAKYFIDPSLGRYYDEAYCELESSVEFRVE